MSSPPGPSGRARTARRRVRPLRLLPRLALVRMNRIRSRGTSSREHRRRRRSATSAPPAPRYMCASSRTRIISLRGSACSHSLVWLEDRPLDRAHQHVLEHRVVSDQHVRAPRCVSSRVISSRSSRLGKQPPVPMPECAWSGAGASHFFFTLGIEGPQVLRGQLADTPQLRLFCWIGEDRKIESLRTAARCARCRARSCVGRDRAYGRCSWRSGRVSACRAK